MMANGFDDTNSYGLDADNKEASTASSSSSGTNFDSQSAASTLNSISMSPSLRFTGVQLYLFRRKQGFNCIPTKGGTTLGMAEKHFDEHRVSFDSGNGDDDCSLSCGSDIESEVNNDSSRMRSGRKRSCSPIPEKCSLAELRPLPVRQRRRLLRLSGVKKIDTTERFECEAIRLSRNECGCQSCGSVCMPDTCPCSLNGIACQVDKMAYPCSCTREGCRNVEGRMEFNASRVRRHLIHTLTKLYAAVEGSSEDSGAVEDDVAVSDNCDSYGRCRHCNQEPLRNHHHRSHQQMQQNCETDDPSEASPYDSNSQELKNSPTSSRQTSAAIVASKMLRRKLTRHWRQQAQSAASKNGTANRLVNKLFLMRRAMASEKSSESPIVSLEEHHESGVCQLGNE